MASECLGKNLLSCTVTAANEQTLYRILSYIIVCDQASGQ